MLSKHSSIQTAACFNVHTCTWLMEQRLNGHRRRMVLATTSHTDRQPLQVLRYWHRSRQLPVNAAP